ncbi:hypothetical protein [Xenorhabdus bovienii]|uniref:hypothetical protein n=1 Tax=Xenorhabdus bovienii TaxID=40576 RepID=UPI00215846E5|nr:hypothetical protein [Xenorhabdus bovienii]
MPPAPAERPPGVRQAGHRSPVAVKNFTKTGCSANNQKKGTLYCITACGESRVKVHRRKPAKQPKSAPRRFRFVGVSRIGKNGSLTI